MLWHVGVNGGEGGREDMVFVDGQCRRCRFFDLDGMNCEDGNCGDTK